MLKNHNHIKFIISVLLSQMAGLIGSIFTMSAIPTWYAYLNKPALNPPSWVFGPVWITLYFLMGVSLFLVWKKGAENKDVRFALIVFGIQLVLNSTWSIVFFGLENPGLALINIILMWMSIVWTMFVFYKVSRTATYLLVPYLLWVSFASYLNYAIWMLN